MVSDVLLEDLGFGGGFDDLMTRYRQASTGSAVSGGTFTFDHADFHASYNRLKDAWADVRSRREAAQAAAPTMCYWSPIDGVGRAIDAAGRAVGEPTSASAVNLLWTLETEMAKFLNSMRTAYIEYLNTDEEGALVLRAGATAADPASSSSAW